jgi:hypothetical protein
MVMIINTFILGISEQMSEKKNMLHGTVHNFEATLCLQYVVDWGINVLLHHADIRSVRIEREQHKVAACQPLVPIIIANTLSSKRLKVLGTSK